MRSVTVWLCVVALVGVGLLAFTFTSERAFTPPTQFPDLEADETDAESPVDEPALATFGSGCFWCTEAVFQQIKGVQSVVSGYSGGSAADATYGRIISGDTGHAEVVQITYDPAVISYAELLHVFWRSHDPTTQDRQGADAGSQYRSVIFTHSDRQHRQAERYRTQINSAKVYGSPLVTEIEPFIAFYPAEAAHQDFFAANPRQPYCRAVIAPKLDKLRAVFEEKVKP